MAENDLPESGVADDQDSEVQYATSLFDDVVATIDDGKTYLEAEISFQKTRAAFAANNGKHVVALGLTAFALFHTALIALVVGLVFALSPILSPLGATAAVFGGLLIGGALLGRAALRRARTIKTAFGDERK